MYMELTWTTILIFDVHFDVQFNGTPQLRDAVFILNHFIPTNYIIRQIDQLVVPLLVNKGK